MEWKLVNMTATFNGDGKFTACTKSGDIEFLMEAPGDGQARETPQSHPVHHRFTRGMRRHEDPACTFRLRYCPGRVHIIIKQFRYRIKNRIFLAFLELYYSFH